MAIGFLSLLQAASWADAVSIAPKVVDGAKKLYDVAIKIWPSKGVVTTTDQSVALPEAATLSVLEARLDSMELEVRDQLKTSAELIRALADQNTQLIQRVESNRIRLLQLAVAVLVLAIFVIADVVLGLFR